MRDRVDSKDECFLKFLGFSVLPVDRQWEDVSKFSRLRNASDPLSKLIKYLTITKVKFYNENDDEKWIGACEADFNFIPDYTYDHVGSIPKEADLSEYKLRYVAKFSLSSDMVSRLIDLIKHDQYTEWQGVRHVNPAKTKQIHAESRQALKDHCLFINCELFNPKENKWYVVKSMYDATPRKICALV